MLAIILVASPNLGQALLDGGDIDANVRFECRIRDCHLECRTQNAERRMKNPTADPFLNSSFCILRSAFMASSTFARPSRSIDPPIPVPTSQPDRNRAGESRQPRR